ncbi:MAG: protein kinase domain-containing protein [Planctomycetota bacterium]|jgi:serine/threonine protein kinase
MIPRSQDRLIEYLAKREVDHGTGAEPWSDLDPALAREIGACSKMERELASLSLLARGHPDRAGPWALLRPLGEGRTGPVYLAEREDGARAAVRLLRGPGAVLLGEAAKAFVGWRHPAVAAVIDADEDWMATEPTVGAPLSRVLGALRICPPADLREVARPLLGALAPVGRALLAAHEAGRFHGGVSPRKIDLEHDGILRIRDFGFDPTMTGRPPTPEGPPLGSPLFLAPEQARAAGEIGPETDAYSLAAVAFALAAGVPPVNGRSLTEVLLRIREGEPRPLSAAAPWVPTELARAVDACRATSPADRVGRLEELARALERP